MPSFTLWLPIPSITTHLSLGLLRCIPVTQNTPFHDKYHLAHIHATVLGQERGTEPTFVASPGLGFRPLAHRAAPGAREASCSDCPSLVPRCPRHCVRVQGEEQRSPSYLQALAQCQPACSLAECGARGWRGALLPGEPGLPDSEPPTRGWVPHATAVALTLQGAGGYRVLEGNATPVPHL